MANVPPLPRNTPIADRNNGLLTPIWSTWFTQVFVRIGGSLAPSNADITAILEDVAELQATVADQEEEIEALQESVVNQNTLTQGRAL